MCTLKRAIREVYERIFDVPFIFHAGRKILTQNFIAEKRMLIRGLELSKSERVLEVGCGTGALSVLFPVEQYIGLDICPDYARSAKKWNKLKQFIIMDARYLGFKEKAFDKVFIVGVLHHLPDNKVRKILKECAFIKAQKVLVLEPIKPPKFDIICGLFTALDRGKYIRCMSDWINLLSKDLRINRKHVFATKEHFYFCSFELK